MAPSSSGNLSSTTRAEISPATFEAVVQHWAKARIDAPLHVISRYDEAAKQLVAVGGLLQGVFVTILALGGMKAHPPILVTLAFFAPLLLQIFCAARVICTVPLEMEALETYQLLKQASNPGEVSSDHVTDAVKQWCKNINDLAKKKHRWLFASNLSLLLNALTATLLLGMLMRVR